MTKTCGNTYTLTHYFDVWGNEDDGWEVNDLDKPFTDLFIADDATEQEILTYLMEIGFLATDDATLFEFEALMDGWEISLSENGCPLCSLMENYTI